MQWEALVTWKPRRGEPGTVTQNCRLPPGCGGEGWAGAGGTQAPGSLTCSMWEEDGGLAVVFVTERAGFSFLQLGFRNYEFKSFQMLLPASAVSAACSAVGDSGAQWALGSVVTTTVSSAPSLRTRESPFLFVLTFY